MTEREGPVYCFFFFNDTATTEIYTLSLHYALPICVVQRVVGAGQQHGHGTRAAHGGDAGFGQELDVAARQRAIAGREGRALPVRQLLGMRRAEARRVGEEWRSRGAPEY